MQELIYMATILLLIRISIIDYKQKIIPDKLNLILLLVGILNLMINLKDWIDYVIVMAIIFAAFLFIAIITKGGIGGGDIKLLSSLSLIFGTQMIEIIVFSFSIAGICSICLLLNKKQKYNSSIALGPYICVGAIINLLYAMI